MLPLIMVIVLLIMMFGSLPTWPHSRSWGYYPSGGIGVVLLILIILFLLGVAIGAKTKNRASLAGPRASLPIRFYLVRISIILCIGELRQMP